MQITVTLTVQRPSLCWCNPHMRNTSIKFDPFSRITSTRHGCDGACWCANSWDQSLLPSLWKRCWRTWPANRARPLPAQHQRLVIRGWLPYTRLAISLHNASVV